jgi:AcrR family transcriptional regulator
MAAKKAAPKKSNTKSAKASSSAAPLDRIVEAGLDEVAAAGWRNLAMDAVAERAGLSLGEVLMQVPSKTHLMLSFLARIDQRTLSPVKRINPEDSPRERLFEILMRRFDALNEKREAAKAVVTGVSRDPAALAAGLCRVERSCAAMLSAAGISTGGLLGLARIQGLKAVAAYSLRAWMNDDSADLSKTMAALDRALARAEKLASFTGLRKRAAPEEDA